jgi:tetratricopeptide (TPR) repeat protein
MKAMIKNILLAAGTLFICLVFCQCKEKRKTESTPSIVHVSKHEVTISWDSPEKYEGVIYYKNADKVKGRPSNGKDLRETSHHRVTITDLLPSTLYSYWIKDAKNRFTFRTEPENDTPFSFYISSGSDPGKEVQLINSESCGFIVTTDIHKKKDLEAVNALVPVFSMRVKPDAPDSSAIQDSWIFNYGNLSLIMINKINPGSPSIDFPRNNYLGIVVNSGIIGNNETDLKSSAFHQNLVLHNKNNQANPVIFVGISGLSQKIVKLDGVNYFSIPDNHIAGNSMGTANGVVVSVDGIASSVYYPADSSESELTIPPPDSRRTCTECLRLAKKGDYEHAISAYLKFIETYHKNYQVDQAYYSIAKIYDEKQYHFSKAKEWYQLLTDSFPESPFKPAAKQRLNFFSAYADCDMIPLEKFETIRNAYNDPLYNPVKQQKQKVHLTARQKELIAKVEEINRNYAACKTVPLITLWLADQYQQDNREKALKYYSSLIEQYPEFSLDNEVQYKIAETYLAAGETGKAKEAFLLVKKVLPQHSEKVDTELGHLNTKSRRTSMSYFAWVVCILLLLTAIFLRPAGIKCPRFKILMFTVLGFIYSFIMFFIASREEIAEDFSSSYKEILLFFLTFAAAIVLSLITGRTYTMKFRRDKKWRSGILGSTLGAVFFICAFYLILFYIYEQYLNFVNF